MKSGVTKILLNPLLTITILVWLYLLIPFLAPIAYLKGNDQLGWKINQVYEKFCHQRVERSIFLFGKEKPISFYTIVELKEANAIPEVNPDPEGYVWPEYFGHDYVGNEDVGFKIPLCIRDIALYGGIGVTLLLLQLLPKKHKERVLSWRVSLILLLLLPMAADGMLQSIVEIFQLRFFPAWYVHSNIKRIITGGMFGIGIGLLVYILIEGNSENRLTKSSKKGKIKV